MCALRGHTFLLKERRFIMNKKLLAGVMAGVMAVGVLTGCGNQTATPATDTAAGVDDVVASSDAIVTGTETIADTKTGKEYNVSDYVTLCDYDNIVIDYDNTKVSDVELHDYINKLLAQTPSYIPINKSVVESGDYVNIDYIGKKDGVAFDGGTANGYVLGIGTGTFIPGFEDGLIGVSVGETVDLNLTFPENYGNSELAGAAVVFTVTVNSIVEAEEVSLDTIDDSYVIANFGLGSVNELIENTREYMIQAKQMSEESDKRRLLIEYLTTNCKVSIPDGFIDGKAKEYITQFENQLKIKENTNLSDYLSSNYNMSVEDFADSVKTNMVSDVETELIFEAIATEKNYTLDVNEYNAYIADCLESTGVESEQELYDIYTTDITDGQKYLMGRYFIQKTLDELFESVQFVAK